MIMVMSIFQYMYINKVHICIYMLPQICTSVWNVLIPESFRYFWEFNRENALKTIPKS